MNSIIVLVYLSVAAILIVFGVKQIKNRKKLRKINQKQDVRQPLAGVALQRKGWFLRNTTAK